MIRSRFARLYLFRVKSLAKVQRNRSAERLLFLSSNRKAKPAFDNNPSLKLETIKAPLFAINSTDDFINPPELGLMEREIKRVKRGRKASFSGIVAPGQDGIIVDIQKLQTNGTFKHWTRAFLRHRSDGLSGYSTKKRIYKSATDATSRAICTMSA